MRRLPAPDEVLLRRFGLVRAVGGGAYIVAVVVLGVILGREIWPLALGVPVLAVATTLYFTRSARYPRTAVVGSLVADALVLGGAVAFLGGTGSGLVMLYSIVVVSAGILLGPTAAAGFTLLSVALSLLQLLVEQMGYPPAVLHRPQLEDRVSILAVSLAGVVSVGYLAGTYASRLHELIAEGGERFAAVQRRGWRRRSFAARAAVDVRTPLLQLERMADELESQSDRPHPEDLRRLAGEVRMAVTDVDAELAQLTDVSVIDETGDKRPEPMLVSRVVQDCIIALSDRLRDHVVEVDIPPVKVLGDRRATRRVVFNLLENVAQHTPPGTRVHVTAVTPAGSAVLVVTDDGPGVPDEDVPRLFTGPTEGRRDAREALHQVGLPLVAELCEAMGAEVRYEPAPGGGSRFMVKMRRAPLGAPSSDDGNAARQPKADVAGQDGPGGSAPA